jgi:hypothetical protein
VEDEYPLPEPIYFQAEFYAAEIEVDAILSYPWLRENGVGVFPHHDALAKDWPEFALLYGWHQTKTNNIPRSPRKGKEKRVRPVLALTGGGAPPSKYGHEPGRWVACDYAVRAPHVQTILDHFGLTPTRDCFANPENRRFEKWWGPGSPEGEDAFLQDWGPEKGLLWMNPPFNIFPQVLEKVRRDQAHVIMIVPAWRRQKFFRLVQEMALDFLKFPKGTHLFEREGKAVRGTDWDVFAF